MIIEVRTACTVRKKATFFLRESNILTEIWNDDLTKKQQQEKRRTRSWWVKPVDKWQRYLSWRSQIGYHTENIHLSRISKNSRMTLRKKSLMLNLTLSLNKMKFWKLTMKPWNLTLKKNQISPRQSWKRKSQPTATYS